jgi:DNA polymerase-1
MEFAFAKDLENAFSIVEDLPKPIVHTEAMARSGVEFITGHREGDFDVLVNFLESCYKCDSIGFDYETGNTEHSPRPYAEGSRILSLAISPKLREAFAFPIDHPKAGWTTTEVTTIKQAISDFLHTAPCKKISHNLSFEQEWSAFFFGEGCLRAQPWEDTMSMAYILDERKGSHSLEFQCLEHFGINIKQLSNIDTKKSLLNIPLNKLLTYNAIDAKYHKLLYHALKERLEESGMWEVYRHQLERVPTAVLTQMKGIPVDSKRVDELYLELTSATKALKAEIANTPEAKKFSKLKDKEFNPSSPVQVKFVFNEIIGKHIDTTAHEVLSQLDDPFAKIISDWRSVIKMNSTYVQPFMTQEELCKYGEKEDRSCIWPDGLVHHALSTARTDTWRTSSGNPNIQNQPKHGEANIGGKIIKLKEFRSQISPLNTDERIVSFDFGQIQARNVAMESKDENLVKSFWDRRDIHSDWAERMVRKYPRWVTEGAKAFANDKKVAAHYRQRSKNEFVFASFFGAQAFSSSQRLGIPENIVEKLLEEFWDEFPEVRSWQKRITKNYFKTGYVTGLSGFRRHAPVGTNQLINAPIQADESIIVLDAMIRLSKIDRNKLQANAEIHDDLWFIWHKKEIDKLSEIVIDEMLKLSFPWINVPLVVERSIGEDWANMTEDNEKYASDTWSK